MDSDTTSKYLMVLYTALGFILSSAWMYLYAAIGFRFQDMFDFNSIYKFLNIPTIIIIILVGLLMAGSIFAVIAFSRVLKKRDLTYGTVLGVGLSIIFCFSFFVNQMIFLGVILFYFIGMVWTSKEDYADPEKMMNKLKIGWAKPKKVVYLLSIGAFLTSLVFVSIDQKEYENQVMDSMLNFTLTSAEQMNMSNILNNVDFDALMKDVNYSNIFEEENESLFTEEEIEQLARQSISKDDIRESLVSAYGTAFTSMTPEQQQQTIDSAYEDYITYMVDNFDPTKLNALVKSMGQNMSNSLQKTLTARISKQVQENMLNSESFKQMQEKLSIAAFDETMKSIPFMGMMFDFLGLLTAFTVLSMIILFGNMVVSPFTALMSLTLPSKPRIHKAEELIFIKKQDK